MDHFYFYNQGERFNHDLIPNSYKVGLISGTLKKEWIEEYSPNPKMIFIVGSCDGGDEIKLNAWYPEAIIHSFEAIKENYDLAVDNISYLNTDKIHVHHYAIFDTDGEIEFNNLKWPTGEYEGSFYLIDPEHRKVNNLQLTKVKVPCITLQTFCKQNNIDSIDVMQVDVEGAGYQVIKGMEEVLPKLICIEYQTPRSFQDGYHQPAPEDDLISLIVEKGYEYVMDLKHEYLFVKK